VRWASYILGCICACPIFSFAQENVVLPVRYHQYFNSPVFINPAASVPQDGFEVRLNSRLQTGPFNNVNSALFYSMFGLKTDDDGPVHQLGVMFQNENEGKFLNRTRFYGLYVQRTRLSPSLFINTGIAMGAMSYAVRSSTMNAGGGATALDGKLGLYLSAKKWSSGLSMNQVFNNKVNLFSAPLSLRRFFSLYGHYRHAFSRQDLTVYYYADVTRDELYAHVNLLLGIDDQVQAGLGYSIEQGVSIYGGLRQVELLRKWFKLGITYFVPMHQRLSNTSVIELSLGLY
jgi:hypothetical protein